ncbi:MAG: Spy/CpxP family protein refolding chaperone [Pyrinomonadaceae bacterium]
MEKILFAILTLAMLTTGVVFAFGQTTQDNEHADRGRRGHHRGGFGMMFRGLGLTEDQKAKMKELRSASHTNLKPTFEALRANRQKMKELTANGAFDEAQVTAIANDQASLSAKLIVERHRMKAQFFSILTDDQKAKLAEIEAKRSEGRKAHRDAKAKGVSE